jgi:outer membrane protein assembly factor BamE (lipoprotein component of BamABCDE complex)
MSNARQQSVVSKTSNTKLIATLAVILAVMAGLGFLLDDGHKSAAIADAQRAQSRPAHSEPKIMGREEFREQVVGQYRDVVRLKLGPPDSTQDSGDRAYWYYSGLTQDSANGKVDRLIQIVFDKYGTVKSVNFN